MKKAKLMFTAVGIFAFVGTALAFTARGNETVYCYNPAISGNHCETLTPATLVAPDEPVFIKDGRCTDDPAITASDCNNLPSNLIDVYVGE